MRGSGTEIFCAANMMQVTAQKISVSWSTTCRLKTFPQSDSCGTVHANAASGVPARLEALGTAAGLDRAALHSQLAAALSVVLHLVRDGTGRRRIAEVHVLERDPAGLVVTVPALRWGTEAFSRGPGWERLRQLLGDAGDVGGVCGPSGPGDLSDLGGLNALSASSGPTGPGVRREGR